MPVFVRLDINWHCWIIVLWIQYVCICAWVSVNGLWTMDNAIVSNQTIVCVCSNGVRLAPHINQKRNYYRSIKYSKLVKIHFLYKTNNERCIYSLPFTVKIQTFCFVWFYFWQWNIAFQWTIILQKYSKPKMINVNIEY